MNITGELYDRPIVTENNNMSQNLVGHGAFVNKGESVTATSTAVITTRNIDGTMAKHYDFDASKTWTGEKKNNHSIIKYIKSIVIK